MERRQFPGGKACQCCGEKRVWLNFLNNADAYGETGKCDHCWSKCPSLVSVLTGPCTKKEAIALKRKGRQKEKEAGVCPCECEEE